MVDLNTKEVEYLVMKDTDAVRIPNNKAHGFLTLEPNTIVVYLVEGDYSPESEHSIPWNTIPEIEKVVLAHSAYNKIITSDKDKIGK
jgi:dTDP-4-dehydrorhamnose 3,5-epimerase-like enzyme